jgi:hypothetical protein
MVSGKGRQKWSEVGSNGLSWASMWCICCARSGPEAPRQRFRRSEVMVVVQRRRGFGRVRRERSGRFSAAYVGPDLQLHRAPETFQARIDAEGWLASERRAIDLEQWVPPQR